MLSNSAAQACLFDDSKEGCPFIAIKSGIQINADDGPTQVIITVPDKGRVTAVAIGGKDKDMLYAFCGNKIWKRIIQQHASVRGLRG